MPIYFSCSKCGKKMFAQDQFAGQRVNCPECHTGNLIPSPEREDNAQPAAHSSSRVTPTEHDDAPREPSHPWTPPVVRVRNEPPAAIWRAIARFAVLVTTWWLIFMLVAMFGAEDTPGFAIAFDLLLIFGLTLSRLQMRNGPYHVFLAAALTVVLAMPLLSQLGFQMINPEVLRYYNEHRQPDTPEFTLELANLTSWVMCSIAGLIVSVPIWIAGIKVAVAERSRNARK